VLGFAGTVAVVLGDADVLAKAFVSTGRAGLRCGDVLTSIFPSSALDRDSLFGLDLSGGGSLLVLVCGGEDAERDWYSGVVIQRDERTSST